MRHNVKKAVKISVEESRKSEVSPLCNPLDAQSQIMAAPAHWGAGILFRCHDNLRIDTRF
jgi:hypothetical protein